LRGKKNQKCSYESRDDTKFGDCFLTMRGNPFNFVIFDEFGKLGLELGVYRVPETFLVDKNGLIVFKYLGEITPDIWQQKISPLIERLQK
jgi:cytochrome c biogenesis protein CcmG/thiol:disulfide interchange protein DsbE